MKPAYLIYGNNSSLVLEATHKLLSQFNNEDIAYYTAGTVSTSHVIESARTLSFLSTQRIIVFYIDSLNAAETEALVKYLESPNQGTILILSGVGNFPKLEKAISNIGEIINTSIGTSVNQKSKWLLTQLQEAQLKISPKAQASIIEHFGTDLDRVKGLLQTLISTYGQPATITDENLKQYLGSAGDIPPWELTDAIDAGDIAKALRLLNRQLEAGGKHGVVILAILHKHFASMLKLDGSGAKTDSQAASILKGSPFVASKSLKASNKLGSNKIQKAILLLADADSNLKGGTGMSNKLVLEILVGRLANLAK